MFLSLCFIEKGVILETHRITQPLEPNGRSDSRSQLQLGTTLATRYLIQDVIGIGGMGAVYRARDLHFPNVVKLVAVKEMINQAADAATRLTIVQNFEREANILATLHHPAIPRIYDYFTQNDHSYLVLELVNGKDLESILTEADGFFEEDQVVGWAIELCDVLAYLHNHKPEPIIFRDMKPSNVMINTGGHVVLVDFGIAKPFQTGQKGTMIGTEGYSPPEQYRGEASIAADIYALGATLHHLLTRRDPRLEAPFSFNERSIRKINPAISQELEMIVNTALQYNAEDRFKNIDALKEALVGLARKTGLLSRMGTTVIQSASAIKPLWTFQCEDELRGTPLVYNGLVYIGCYDNNLYALNAADGKFAWKYPTDGGVVSRPAAFEGNIYIGSQDRRLHTVNARSGKVVWTYYTDGPIHSSPRIAENHAFIGSDDKHLHAVNLGTGRASWRFETSAEIWSTPFVAENMVLVANENGDLYALDFRSTMKWRFQAKRGITSSPVVQDRVVYFTALDGMLYALDINNGFVLWRFRMDKPSIVTPCVQDGMVFAGSADNNIYALDARTAKEIWRFRTENQVSGSPIIYKDALYCGGADGHLYCLEYRTGRLRWKFETKGPITGAPVAFDDIIYFGSIDHFVYALMA